MGNAAVAEELDELYRLDASEPGPEPEPEDDGDEDEEDDTDDGDDGPFKPGGIPHP